MLFSTAWHPRHRWNHKSIFDDMKKKIVLGMKNIIFWNSGENSAPFLSVKLMYHNQWAKTKQIAEHSVGLQNINQRAEQPVQLQHIIRELNTLSDYSISSGSWTLSDYIISLESSTLCRITEYHQKADHSMDYRISWLSWKLCRIV
jgi:maltose-binding protein MalE